MIGQFSEMHEDRWCPRCTYTFFLLLLRFRRNNRPFKRSLFICFWIQLMLTGNLLCNFVSLGITSTSFVYFISSMKSLEINKTKGKKKKKDCLNDDWLGHLFGSTKYEANPNTCTFIHLLPPGSKHEAPWKLSVVEGLQMCDLITKLSTTYKMDWKWLEISCFRNLFSNIWNKLQR